MVIQYRDHTRDLEVDADVVVVGSGAGGACAAAELAEGGLSVVLLEEGGFHGTREFTAEAGKMIRTLYRDCGATFMLGRPGIPYVEGRCVGGSTVINGGMCWRTPERFLKRWAWETGVQDVDPQRLVPYFQKVEERIHVAPQDPGTTGKDDELFVRGARAVGQEPTPNRRNQHHCMGSNNCALGCPTGGKQSTLVTYVPRVERAGGRIYSDVKVVRILTENGRAVGVEGDVLDRATRRPIRKARVRSRIVVLACGAVQTPALLLRNRLANSSGQVGRNLMIHPNAKLLGIFDEEVRPWEGVHQAHQLHSYLEEGLNFAIAYVPPSIVALGSRVIGEESLAIFEQFSRSVISGVLVEDTTRGRVIAGPGGTPLVSYFLNRQDARQVVRGAAILAELLFAAGAKRILMPFHFIPELTRPDQIPRLWEREISPAEMELITVHLMGTCRMGSDRRRSVVDSYGESHDVRGLFLADASLFPTPIGVNPMETIMMLATRQADYILNRRANYLSR